MSGTDDLPAFLRARLDEDEALAREAPAGPWHIGNAVNPTQPCHVHTFPGVRMVADGLNWLAAEHIARHDPARVLAEVDAKRKVVNDYEQAERYARAYWGQSNADQSRARTLAKVTRLLALPYADHPDYRKEWRP